MLIVNVVSRDLPDVSITHLHASRRRLPQLSRCLCVRPLQIVGVVRVVRVGRVCEDCEGYK